MAVSGVTKRRGEAPKPRIGCSLHGSLETQLPCQWCRSQGELFTRREVAQGSRRDR